MKLNDINYGVLTLDIELLPIYSRVKNINSKTIINNVTSLNRQKFSEISFVIFLNGNFNRISHVGEDC